VFFSGQPGLYKKQKTENFYGLHSSISISQMRNELGFEDTAILRITIK
jgi:HD superfamily phosphohydrolase YqeK